MPNSPNLSLPTIGLLFSTLMVPACIGTTEVSQQNFDLARTHYRLGADYLQKQKSLEAKRELKKSIKLDPKYRDPYHLLGVLIFVEAMYKLNLVDRAQCLQGKEADEQRKVANIDFRKAETLLNKSIKMAEEIEKKNDTESLIYISNISLHFKRYKEAVRLSKKALENDVYPGRHLARAVLGWSYFKMGKLEAAGRELRQAIYDRPKFCLGLYRLAKVYYEQKKYDRVITELEKIAGIKACPIQEVPYLLGLAYMKSKKTPEKAGPQFGACLKTSPRSCLAMECKQLLKNVSHLTAQGGRETVESTQ